MTLVNKADPRQFKLSNPTFERRLVSTGAPEHGPLFDKVMSPCVNS